MDCVTITTELVNCEEKLYSVSNKDYKLDIWRELKKRWMIIGVLISMTLAVLSPKVGAPGGKKLHDND